MMRINQIDFDGIDLLADLYRIWSPSRGEKEMSNFVAGVLDEHGIVYHEYGNCLYRIIPDAPMICAHMDEVSNKPKKNKLKVKFDKRFQDLKIYNPNGAIGGDDKNGIWILLQILTDPDFKNKLSFIFSVEEECGGMTEDIIEMHLKDFETVPYCLVFDRWGFSDVIGVKNRFCCDDLMEALEPAMRDFAYSSSSGFFCDAQTLSCAVACVNISCGYYQPHTEQDFTILSDLRRALEFGIAILKSVPRIKYNLANNKWRMWDDDWDFVPDNDDDDESLDVWVPCCPLCDGDMIEDSPYTIGDCLCMECGTVYDSVDCHVHFTDTWTEKNKLWG
jgi:hypothetical protein